MTRDICSCVPFCLLILTGPHMGRLCLSPMLGCHLPHRHGKRWDHGSTAPLWFPPPAHPPTNSPTPPTSPLSSHWNLLFFHVCSTSQLPLISGLTLAPPISPPVPTSQGLDPFLLPALPYPASTSPLVPPCTLWVCTYPCHKFLQFYPVLYWKCTIKVCSSNNGNLLHFKCWNNLLICGVDFYLGFCPKAKPRSSSHPSQWWWWWVSHI